MEIFMKSRLAWARIMLRRRVRKTFRKKKFNNLRNAHKIGMVWDGSYIADFTHVTAFYQRMLEAGIQVDIVCYFPGKVLPDEYTALRYLTCFKRNDLNFFYIPRLDDINEFISTPYEILIDINFSNKFPLFYLTSLSKAEFKIGAGGTINESVLDMTLELNKGKYISYYLEQVEHYLNMINTGV